MRTSQSGINLIKKHEGCRLQAYRCAAGVPTIGYGHTAGVRMGQTITQTQAESFLKDDLIKFEKRVEKYDSKYDWNQNEFDALVSFAYNIGSIDQLTAYGTRSRTQIAKKLTAYNKAGGRILAGLTARRKAEKALFLKPVSSSAAQPDQKADKPVQAASIPHIQLNYKAGQNYTAQVNLNIRDKPSTVGRKTGSLPQGKTIRTHATTRCGEQIWMYFGLDGRGREKWVCADSGEKAYIS